MIINSRFAIFSYLGRDPLPLLSAPPGLGDSERSAYSNFIQSVDTIYASQQNSGLIPTFYKTDGAPDTNSSLKSLTPGESYYVVMTSSAKYPVNVPAIGGLSSGGTGTTLCSVSQIPTISFPAPAFTLEGEANHYQYLTISFSQLVPKVRYRYTLTNFQSNWPIKILPREGVFTPSSTTESINAYLMFAPTLSSVDCPDCFTNYTLDPDYREPHGQNNLYSILQVSIVPEPFDVCTPVNDTVMIRCKSCLPRRIDNYPIVKFENAPVKTLNADCAFESVPINVACSNFDKGKPYKYQFSVDNNVSTVVPNSGIVGFGDGVGKITGLLNIQNMTPVIIKVEVVTQDGLNKTSTDFLTVECTDCQ